MGAGLIRTSLQSLLQAQASPLQQLQACLEQSPIFDCARVFLHLGLSRHEFGKLQLQIQVQPLRISWLGTLLTVVTMASLPTLGGTRQVGGVVQSGRVCTSILQVTNILKLWWSSFLNPFLVGFFSVCRLAHQQSLRLRSEHSLPQMCFRDA